jgi:hypothetical protein
MVSNMFGRIKEMSDRIRAWWDSLEPISSNDPASRMLAFFQPGDSSPMPRALRQILAAGALASLFALGGVALFSLSGLLLSLFAIYFLVTEILGLEVEIDPRLWQAV